MQRTQITLTTLSTTLTTLTTTHPTPHTTHSLSAAVITLDALTSTDPDWALLSPTPTSTILTPTLFSSLASLLATYTAHIHPPSPPRLAAAAFRAASLLAAASPAALSFFLVSRSHEFTALLVAASFADSTDIAQDALALLRLTSLVDSGTLTTDPLLAQDIPPSDLQSCAACAICQLDIHPHEWVVPLPCGHIFHRTEILRWLASHPSCPSCRSPAWGKLPHSDQSIQSRLQSIAAHLPSIQQPPSSSSTPSSSTLPPTATHAFNSLGPTAPLSDHHLHTTLSAYASPSTPYSIRLPAARALARCVHDNAWGAHLVCAHFSEISNAIADAIALDLDCPDSLTPPNLDHPFPLAAASLSLLASLVSYQMPLPLFLHADEIFMGNPTILDVIWSAVPVLFVPSDPDFYAATALARLVGAYAATGSVADVLRCTGFVPFIVHSLHAALAAPDAPQSGALLFESIIALKVLLRPDRYIHPSSNICDDHQAAGLFDLTDPWSTSRPPLELYWYRADGLYEIPCTHLAVYTHGGMFALADILDSPITPPDVLSAAATVTAALAVASVGPIETAFLLPGIPLALARAMLRTQVPMDVLTDVARAVAAMAPLPAFGPELLIPPMLDAFELALGAAIQSSSPHASTFANTLCDALYNMLIANDHETAVATLVDRPLVHPLVARIANALASSTASSLLPPLRVLHAALCPPHDLPSPPLPLSPMEAALTARTFLLANMVDLVPDLLRMGGTLASLSLDICARLPPSILSPLLAAGFGDALVSTVFDPTSPSDLKSQAVFVLTHLASSDPAAPSLLAELSWLPPLLLEHPPGLPTASLNYCLALELTRSDGWDPPDHIESRIQSLVQTHIVAVPSTILDSSSSSPPHLFDLFRVLSALASEVWDLSTSQGPWMDALASLSSLLAEAIQRDSPHIHPLLPPILSLLCSLPRHTVGAPQSAPRDLIVALVAHHDALSPPSVSALLSILGKWAAWPQFPLESSLHQSPTALDALASLVSATPFPPSILARLVKSPLMRSWLASHPPLLLSIVQGYAQDSSENIRHYGNILLALVEPLPDDCVEWWQPAEVAKAAHQRQLRIQALLDPASEFLSSMEGWGPDHVTDASALLICMHILLGCDNHDQEDVLYSRGQELVEVAATTGRNSRAIADALMLLDVLDARGAWSHPENVFAVAHPDSVWSSHILFCAPAIQYPRLQRACLGLAATFVARAADPESPDDITPGVVHHVRWFTGFSLKLLSKLVDLEVTPGPPESSADPSVRFDCALRALDVIQAAATSPPSSVLHTTISNLLNKHLAGIELELGETEWVDAPQIDQAFSRIRDLL